MQRHNMRMVIQVINIASGFLLAAPKLKEFGAKDEIDALHAKLNAFSGTLGVVTLALGVLALIERMGIMSFPIPMFGSSYPQALPAIAVGLILSAHLFESHKEIHDVIMKLKVYEIAIGVAALLSGAGSLLFGCLLCF